MHQQYSNNLAILMAAVIIGFILLMSDLPSAECANKLKPQMKAIKRSNVKDESIKQKNNKEKGGRVNDSSVKIKKKTAKIDHLINQPTESRNKIGKYRNQAGGHGQQSAAGGEKRRKIGERGSSSKHGTTKDYDQSESVKGRNTNPTIGMAEGSSSHNVEMCECRQYRRDEQTKRTINNSDYDTIVQIGSGNEGDVFHAYSKFLKRCVAIKLCEQLEGTENWEEVVEGVDSDSDNEQQSEYDAEQNEYVETGYDTEQLVDAQPKFKPTWGCHREIEVLQAALGKHRIVQMLDNEIEKGKRCNKINTYGDLSKKCNYYYVVMELGKISLAKLLEKYVKNETIEKYNLSVDQIINDIYLGVNELHSIGFSRVDGNAANAVIFKNPESDGFIVKIIDFTSVFEQKYDKKKFDKKMAKENGQIEAIRYQLNNVVGDGQF